MPKIVKDLLLSKKFVTALLTAICAFAAYFGWNVDVTHILVIVSPMLAFIGAQGWADSGKESALVSRDTVLQSQQMRQLHEVRMAEIAAKQPSGLNVAAPASSQAGFARLGLLVVMAAVLGISAVLAACAHPLQDTLRDGQCVLDSGVVGTVFSDLEQANYKQLIADLFVKAEPALVDCALKAAAAGSPPASGSGAQPRMAVVADVRASRAREILAERGR